MAIAPRDENRVPGLIAKNEITGGPIEVKATNDGELLMASSITIGSSIKVTQEFNVNDIEEAGGSITYIGKEDSGGEWWIVKIDESASPITIQHASIATDAAQTSYSLAWTNRATLSYTDYSGAF